MVRVKSNKDGDIRRFVLPDNSNYQALREQLSSIYSQGDFTVKYKDDEGDLVTISSDAELSEAVTTAGESNLLRLDVLSRMGQRSATPTTGPAPAPVPGSLPFPVMPNVPGIGSRPMFPPPSVPNVAIPPPFAPPHPGRPGMAPPPMMHPPHPAYHPPPPPPPHAPHHPPAHPGPGAYAPAPAPATAPAAASRAPPAPGSEPEPSASTSAPGGSSGGSGGSGDSSSASVEFTPEQVLEGITQALSGMFTSGAFTGMGGGGGGGGGFVPGGPRGRFMGGGGRGMRGRGRGCAAGGGAGGRGRGGGGDRFRSPNRGRFVRRDIPSEGPGSEWLRVLSLNENDLGEFFRNFNPQDLGAEFRNISENTLNELRTLITDLMRAPGIMVVLSAVPLALPTLRGFLAELQAGVPITGERIDVLAVALSTTLSGVLGAENAGRVAEFARTAARDEGVLALLRSISGIGASWGGSAADAARDAGGDAAARVERAFQ